MGLDMYLTAKRYISDFCDDDQPLRDALAVLEVNNMKVKELSHEAGYWRKANQIHKWFVDNVQEGNDNCGEYLVTTEQLERLLELVNEVLRNRDKANEVLPTANGFFFGSYDYDEGYFDDLIQTKAIIENVLALDNFNRYDIYYSSSW